MKTNVQARRLIEWLRAKGRDIRPLTILTHDHPDPDSLASAWALSHLAQGVAKVRTRILYGGIIGRAENRIMAERLMIPAYPTRPGELREAPHVALVDTQPPFRNNRFPPRRKPDLIIDHHPRHAETQAELVLIDESIGATSTILAEALLCSGLRIPKRLATALLYGIGSETQNLGREAGPRDMDIYQALWPKANMRALWKISYPKRTTQFFQDLARGIRNAFLCRGIIGVHLGSLGTPDRVAQVADFLLTHEKVRWSIVTGRYQSKLHVSLRTSEPRGGAGRLLKRLLGGGNRGGGHGMIAGGLVEVGAHAPEGEWRDAEEKVIRAFLHSQGVKETAPRVYPFR
ncbi:MAG: DHH family phosphoesterase [Elusimicrobia bacterium]|nr:DHH family phosphoesterase [Elusimicrobiota bacterium]